MRLKEKVRTASISAIRCHYLMMARCAFMRKAVSCARAVKGRFGLEGLPDLPGRKSAQSSGRKYR
jgi:hypothetical protein